MKFMTIMYIHKNAAITVCNPLKMYIYQNGEGKVIGLITVLLALRDQRPEPTKKT